MRSGAPTSSARRCSTTALAERVREIARSAWGLLGCRGFARIDMILGDDGPTVLEVNAIPGLTETSLLPQAADAAGSASTRSSRGSSPAGTR